MRRVLLGSTLVLLVVLGIASAAYVLVHQRLRLPLREVYHVDAELSAADGVAPGLGQPVQVAGVKVGTISASRLRDGVAVITLEIKRSELPRVHADARVALQPVTPLKDMQIDLDPGSDRAPVLRDGATIGLARTSTPAGLQQLLSSLDADTRAFVQTLIDAAGAGTRGRADNLRRALLALGPTAAQARDVTSQLDRRRRNLARLVHNLAIVTRAASEDRQLASVVKAGQQVLHAVATRSVPLDEALRRLPGTLTTVDRTLDDTAGLARALQPALPALTPAVKRLPQTLAQVAPFAREATSALRTQVRPLVREARPLVRELGPAAEGLRSLTPPLTSALRVSKYTVNELAYNPPGDDEGFLFWFPWWFHNYTSMFSAQDAHGSAARAMILGNCQQVNALAGFGDVIKLVTGLYNVCQGNG
jgi:virulence factor Mce-like protein